MTTLIRDTPAIVLILIWCSIGVASMAIFRKPLGHFIRVRMDRYVLICFVFLGPVPLVFFTAGIGSIAAGYVIAIALAAVLWLPDALFRLLSRTKA